MGCWNHTCGLTNLPIYAGMPVVALPVLVQRGGRAAVAGLPIRGHYNDYGFIEEEGLLNNPQWGFFLKTYSHHALRSAYNSWRYHFKRDVDNQTYRGTSDRFEAVLQVIRDHKSYNYYRQEAQQALDSIKKMDVVRFCEHFRGNLRVPEIKYPDLPREEFILDFLLIHEKAWEGMIQQGKSWLQESWNSWWGKEYTKKIQALEDPDAYWTLMETTKEEFQELLDSLERASVGKDPEKLQELTESVSFMRSQIARTHPLFTPWTGHGDCGTPTHHGNGRLWESEILRRVKEGDKEWVDLATEICWLFLGLKANRKELVEPPGAGSQNPVPDSAEKWLDTQREIIHDLNHHWDEDWEDTDDTEPMGEEDGTIGD